MQQLYISKQQHGSKYITKYNIKIAKHHMYIKY